MREEFDFRDLRRRPGPRSARSPSRRSRSCTRSRPTGCASPRGGADRSPTPATPAPCEALDRLAAGADLLLAEASFRDGDDEPAGASTSPARTAASSRPAPGSRAWCSPTSRRGSTRPRCSPRRRRSGTAPSSWPPPARPTSLSRSDQAGVVDADRDLDAVGDLQLVEEPGHVCLHGGHGQVELARRSRRCSGRGRPRGRRRARGRSVRRAGALRPRPGRRPRRRGAAGSGSGSPRATASGRPRPQRGWPSRICGGGVSLSRNPSAPAASASTTYSSASNVVSTITRGGSGRACSARVASSPSTPGIRMSMSTTSGRSPSTRRTPSRPSPASPTTSTSGWPPSIRVKAERTSGSSSTTRTRGSSSRGPRYPRRAAPTTNPRARARRCPPRSSARSVSPTSPRPDPGVELAPNPSGLRSTTSTPSSGEPRRSMTKVGAGRVLAGVGDPLLDDPVHGAPDRLGHRLVVGQRVAEGHAHARLACLDARAPPGRRTSAAARAPGRRRRPSARQAPHEGR